MWDRKKIALVGLSSICAALLATRGERLETGTLARWAAEGFTVSAVATVFPADTRFAVSQQIDISKILDQKFTYFAKGLQCFAFLSEDGQYVLKFFKQDKFLGRRFYSAKKLRKRISDFTSYKIAYEGLREETGLLFLHLVPHDGLQQKVNLVDRLGNTHTVDLGDFEFLMQRRADPIIPALDAVMKQGEEEKAKGMIDALFTFFHRRLDKGILDLDPTIFCNLGLLEGRVVQIDIGRFLLPQTAREFKNDFERFQFKNRQFAKWLEERYPTLYSYYLEQRVKLEGHYQEKISMDFSRDTSL